MTKTSLSGSVIDGAIQGATVFLDLNNNQIKDAGEPVSQATAADGSYSIDTTGLSTDQIKKAHLVTLVPDTAKDADDNGQTLAQAGKASFTLMAPAAAYVAADGTVSGAVVSPVTTLVSHDMVKDNVSLTEATTNVQNRLGVSSTTNLMQDPGKDATLKSLAPVIAVAIGQVNKLATDASNSTVTVSEREALLAALTYIQQNIAALKKAVEDALAAETSKKLAGVIADLVGSTSSNADLKADTSTLLGNAQQVSNSTPATALDFLQAGGYEIMCIGDSCNTEKMFKLSATATAWTTQEYEKNGNNWSTRSIAAAQ